MPCARPASKPASPPAVPRPMRNSPTPSPMTIAARRAVRENRLTSERGRIGTSGSMRESQSPRNAPPRGGPGADVLRLQRAMGNAAVGRLLAPQRRTLARFGEGEHKAIGDKAVPDRRWALPGANLFKELQMTFGEWISLGDWFEDIAEIKEMLRAHRDG